MSKLLYHDWRAGLSCLNDGIGNKILQKAFGSERSCLNKDGSHTLNIDLPGHDRKDIKLKLQDGMLSISAITGERHNRFSYVIGDVTNITARYINGVLSVTYFDTKPPIKDIPVE